MRIAHSLPPPVIILRPHMDPTPSPKQSYDEWLAEAVQKSRESIKRGEYYSFEDIKKYWEKYFEDKNF